MMQLTPRGRISKLHLLALVLMLAAIATACQDITSPVSAAMRPDQSPLPSLTTLGGNTITLVGSELLFHNGKRLRVDSATARTFRSLAVSMPKTQDLVRSMAPLWTRMGLPEPTSPLQARLALAALKERSANPANLDVLALTNVPVTPVTSSPAQKKPTLVAECDPVFTFCGFDTGHDPNAGGSGGSGGGGAGSSGDSPLCVSALTALFLATAEWDALLRMLDQFVGELLRCSVAHPSDWMAACSGEAGRVSLAMTQVALATQMMYARVQALRALECI